MLSFVPAKAAVHLFVNLVLPVLMMIVAENLPDEAVKPPIDLGHLTRFTLGNRDLEREVLGLFCDHAPEYIERLRQAETSRHWHEAAHTLKGSAGAVGAWKVAELAAIAEKLREDPDVNGRRSAVKQLESAVGEAARHIAALYPPGA